MRIGCVVFVMVLAACGAGPAETSATDPEPAPGTMQMRGSDQPTGSLTPLRTVESGGAVAEGGVDDGTTEAEPDRLIPEPAGRGRAVALVEGRFNQGRGFRMEDVPRHVRMFRVALDPPTWEVVSRGRRVALIQEQPFGRGGARGRTGPFQRTVRVARWGSGPARVRLERFSSESHVFRIERRVSGTDWIGRGFLVIRR